MHRRHRRRETYIVLIRGVGGRRRRREEGGGRRKEKKKKKQSSKQDQSSSKFLECFPHQYPPLGLKGMSRPRIRSWVQTVRAPKEPHSSLMRKDAPQGPGRAPISHIYAFSIFLCPAPKAVLRQQLDKYLKPERGEESLWTFILLLLFLSSYLLTLDTVTGNA